MIDRRTVIVGLSAAALIAAKPPQRLTLTGAKDRKIDVWKWAAKGRRKGRIHFSHGNFSSPIKYDRLLAHWALNGWDVLAPLHVDSTDHPDKARYGPMDSWAARLEDLALLATGQGNKPYVAAGHSYGALMALVKGGVTPLLPGKAQDTRVSAVIALSPPGAMPGLVDVAGFSKLAVPALFQTGDKDVFPGQPPESWRDHLTAFNAAIPGGHRHVLVLDQIDHYFGGIIGRPELPGPRQEAQFDYLKAVSDQFLDCFEGKTPNGLRLKRLAFKQMDSVKWVSK